MEPPPARHAFPRAILHIDGDAFFASCEQSCRPQLQGRPVVTGKERGIAAWSCTYPLRINTTDIPDDRHSGKKA